MEARAANLRRRGLMDCLPPLWLGQLQLRPPRHLPSRDKPNPYGWLYLLVLQKLSSRASRPAALLEQSSVRRNANGLTNLEKRPDVPCKGNTPTAPSEQVTRKEPSGALSIEANAVRSLKEGTTTSFPIRNVNPFGPLTEFTLRSCLQLSGIFVFTGEANLTARREFKRPFPLMLKVADPDSPIRTLSPEKIVISAGARNHSHTPPRCWSRSPKALSPSLVAVRDATKYGKRKSIAANS